MAASIETVESTKAGEPRAQFSWFSRLPYELRLQIWSLCVPRRVFTLRASPGLTCKCTSKRKRPAELATISMVCQEARYSLLHSHKFLKYNACHSFLYKPRTDVIVINAWEPPTSLRYYLADPLHPFYHAVRADRIVLSESIFSIQNPQLDGMLGQLMKYKQPFTLCIAEIPMSNPHKLDVRNEGEQYIEGQDVLVNIDDIGNPRKLCARHQIPSSVAKTCLQWEGSKEELLVFVQRQIEDIYLDSCFQSDWPYQIPAESDPTFYSSGTTRWNMEHAWTRGKMRSMPTFTDLAILFHCCEA